MAILVGLPRFPGRADYVHSGSARRRTTQLLQGFGRTVRRQHVDFSEIVRTNRIARYRSYDGRIHVSERDGGSAASGSSCMPLSTSLSLE
jgi:hypothetical protein